MTLTLVLLNVIVYLWDRQGHLVGPNVVFADLSMHPNQVVAALHGAITRDNGADLFPIVTIFTSMFLHAGLMHIAGNMIFLWVFGAGVEEAIGPVRFGLYYLAWGIAAAVAQIYVDPASTVATLGASGAIGGVLGAYFLLFPSNKIEIYVPMFLFFTFSISAWILLGLWFAWQIFAPQPGVANWAHVGGFLAGMLTVLVLGGRSSIMTGRKSEGDLA